MDESGIICDEIIEVKETNFNEKKVTCKMHRFYVLLAFLLLTIALLIAVSIYYYLVKYQAKNLLPFHDTKFKQFCIDSINWKWVLKIYILKNYAYYFFDDIINIKGFDPNNIKIDENSYKNILIYYIGYVTIKKDLKIYCVNRLYLIFGNVNG